MQATNISDSTGVVVQAMIEQLMQEWKVGDFAVAESIFKSRQRQLKQKGGAQMRQKMQVGKPRVCEKERKGKTTRFGINLCDNKFIPGCPGLECVT